jgi:hypothetical protein
VRRFEPRTACFLHNFLEGFYRQSRTRVKGHKGPRAAGLTDKLAKVAHSEYDRIDPETIR